MGVGLLGALLLIGIGAVDLDRWTTIEPTLPQLETVAVELHSTWRRTIRDWVVLWLPFAAYHTLAGSVRRGTLGAWATGLSIVGPNGHAASALRGGIRGGLYILWPLTGLLAPLWTFVSSSQRGLHDLLAGAWVVRDPARLQKRTP